MPTFLYNSVTSRHKNLIAIKFYIKSKLMKSKQHNLCDDTIATIVIIHNYTYDEEFRTWKVKKMFKSIRKDRYSVDAVLWAAIAKALHEIR